MRPTVERKARAILEQAALSRINREENPKIVDRIVRETAHSVDVLNWVKRLKPDASGLLQAAALLHDVERIVFENSLVGFQGDRSSQEYAQYKKEHAGRSARIARDSLLGLRVRKNRVEKVESLISLHDAPWEKIQDLEDEDLEVLVTADTFSFFTMIGEDMWRRDGIEKLTEKVKFMISKLSPKYMQVLSTYDFTDPEFGLKPDYARVINQVVTEVLNSQQTPE